MRYSSIFFFCVLCFLLFSCSSLKHKEEGTPNSVVSVKAAGSIIPQESISKPVVIPAGIPFVTSVGKLSEKEGYCNSVQAGKPSTLKTTDSDVRFVGKDGCKTPRIVKAVQKQVFCKAPDVVEVKAPSVKDNNPYNFSSFSKLQGLNHDQIRSMVQDSEGNLWLGTDDGATKFDGKYFSHYSLKQGFRNNLILSVFQDSKKNMWFGTFAAGVTKYDGSYLTNYSKSDGLPTDVVNGVFEDRSGNIWFATGAGAVMFDGRNFTIFSTEQGLCGNDVRSVIQDNTGKIWIATNDSGISVFDGKSFSNYTLKNGFVCNKVTYLYKDVDGNIWIATDGGGVVKYDGNSFVSYTKKEGLCDNSVRTILQDADGSMWFGSKDKGLSKFDGRFFSGYGAREGIGSEYIRCSLKDSNNNLWFGTRDAGLVRYLGNIFTSLTVNEGLSLNRVMNIMQDKTGKIWLGTFGGYVTIVDYKDDGGVERPYFSVFGEKEGLLDSKVYCVFQDKKGRIWFGTDGKGISVYDGRTTASYTTIQGLCGNSIRKIYQDRDGNMWIASYGSGVSKFDGKSFTNYSTKQGLSNNNVLSIIQSKNGDIWFGTDGGGLTRYDGQRFIHYVVNNGFFSNIVYTILEDKDGTLWFGTGGSGLVMYDGKNFTKYSEECGLNNSHILSLLKDSKNNIWAGTRFGINILKPEEITHIKKKDRLPLIRSYNYEDGFIGIGCNFDAINEDNKGLIWIGTADRLTIYHPDAKRDISGHAKLQLTSIQLFHEDIPWTDLATKKDSIIILKNGLKLGHFKFDTLSKWNGLPVDLDLSYRQNYLTFNYIGVSTMQSSKIRYKYMLEGVDNDWNVPTERTYVSYANLKSGKYIFRVKALDSEGVWSNEEDYSFSVSPPWWNSQAFYAFVFILLVVSVNLLIKFREQQLKKEKENLKQQVLIQTQQLLENNIELQRLNTEKDKLFSIIAHDLRGPLGSFLGLTQIMSEEIDTLSKDQVHEIVVSMKSAANNLSRLLENLLQWSRIQRGVIPFNPSVINMRSVVAECVLTLQGQARSKGVVVKNEVSEELHVMADKSMMDVVIRNLVSNAIKFTQRGGKVIISSILLNDSKVEISVKDTGIGISASMMDDLFRLDGAANRAGTEGEPSTGLGLIICRDFIERHGAHLSMESEEGKGSKFSFILST